MNCDTADLKCLGKTLNMDHHNMQEEVSVGLPASTEEVPVGLPASTEEVPLTYCKISEFLRLCPMFSRTTLFRQVEQGKVNVRRDIQSGLPVRPYELAIYSM